MKKLFIVFLTLVLAVLMLVPAALPVAADAPDNQPVAWVNSSTNSNNDPSDHTLSVISVKLLADGTTVGQVLTHHWTAGATEVGTTFFNNFGGAGTNFGEIDGSKFFEFVVLMHIEPAGLDLHIKMKLIDNGEPGKYNDQLQVWFWGPDFGIPDSDWLLLFGPSAITNGNIQVHLPD